MSSKQLYLHFVNKRVNELLKEKKCKITIITLEPVLNINKMDKNLKKNRTCDFKKLVQEAISKIITSAYANKNRFKHTYEKHMSNTKLNEKLCVPQDGSKWLPFKKQMYSEKAKCSRK